MFDDDVKLFQDELDALVVPDTADYTEVVVKNEKTGNIFKTSYKHFLTIENYLGPKDDVQQIFDEAGYVECANDIGKKRGDLIESFFETLLAEHDMMYVENNYQLMSTIMIIVMKLKGRVDLIAYRDVFLELRQFMEQNYEYE